MTLPPPPQHGGPQDDLSTSAVERFVRAKRDGIAPTTRDQAYFELLEVIAWAHELNDSTNVLGEPLHLRFAKSSSIHAVIAHIDSQFTSGDLLAYHIGNVSTKHVPELKKRWELARPRVPLYLATNHQLYWTSEQRLLFAQLQLHHATPAKINYLADTIRTFVVNRID